MSRNLPHPDQHDLFTKPVFACRQRTETIDVERFRSRLKRAMSAAIRECGKDRQAIVQEMAQLMRADFSKAMLDAYTSEAKTTHDISVVRFKALVRATGTNALWDVAVSDDGLIVLAGDEARLAEIGRLQQKQREIAEQLKCLRAVPVAIKRNAE